MILCPAAHKEAYTLFPQSVALRELSAMKRIDRIYMRTPSSYAGIGVLVGMARAARARGALAPIVATSEDPFLPSDVTPLRITQAKTSC